MSTHPAFIKAFVATCYQHGFNEKQASELLDTYAKAEFCSTDPSFREGVAETFKSAGLLRNIGIPLGIGLGAGALTSPGILPEQLPGGAATGGILGGALGLLATRGRGLGGALSRIGGAISKGGVGRTSAKELGKLLSNPSLLKGTARGALAGTVASGVTKGLNEGVYIPGRFPMMDPNTGVPSYMQAPGGGGAGADSGLNDPFDLPREIMAQRTQAAPAALGSGIMAQIQNQRQQILDLNNQISNLERNLPLASNPSAAMQRQQLQAQIDNLKMQRNMATTGIMQLEEQSNRDRYNIADRAATRQQAASQGLQSAQREFENLRRRQDFASQGGFLGGLMDVYNRISGAQGRMAELDPIYSGYQQQLEEARRLQQLAGQ